MRTHRLLAIAGVIFFSYSAQAQMGYGYGLYGGMQSCGYGVELGAGAQEVADQIGDLDDALKERRKELRTANTDLRKTRGERDKAKRAILAGLKEPYGSVVTEHIASERRCDDYLDESIPEDQRTNPGDGERIPVSANVIENFQRTNCVGSKVNKLMCTKVQTRRNGTVEIINKCEEALSTYSDLYKKTAEHELKVANLKEEVKRLEREKKELKRDFKAAIKEDAEEARDEGMEGNICVDCLLYGNGSNSGGYLTSQGPSTGQVVGSLAMGALGLFAGYKMGQYQIDNNAKLGWPTTGMSPWLYGLPFALGGIYGAVSGGVSGGGYGCAGGYNGGGFNAGAAGMMGLNGMGGGAYGGMGMGMWGNPYLGMNPMGGGMYMPGMMGAGPWGNFNPYMMGGGMMGAMMGNMMGAMMGGVMGGMMYGNMAGNMMGGMMGAAMYGNMMGNMMMGGMMPGMAMGGMMGVAMGGMMGNMMMGGMMPGMAMGGMIGAAMYGGGMMGNMMGGGMMGNMMYGGMMGTVMYGGMMPGMAMNGMMGAMMGNSMMGGMMGSMDGGLGSLQMQQMMMQSQMQTYQTYMNTIQQQQQNSMAKYRVISGLQEELTSLQYRLQQAYMGYGVDSYSSGSSYYYRDTSMNSGSRAFPGGTGRATSTTGR